MISNIYCSRNGVRIDGQVLCRACLTISFVLAAFFSHPDSYSVACPAPNPGFMGDDDDDDDEPRFQTLSRVTISFAEDGTQISRFKNSLFSSFSHLMTREELEDTVLEAFQEWVRHSAINVGLVEEFNAAGMPVQLGEPGLPFGTGGLSQGDRRFGDIRVGAVPMAGDVFAIAVPNIDFVSGTWSGDLLFNSEAEFIDADQFFAVALHEAGHVLGLGHTEDTTSAMHPTELNTELNAFDILDLQALYGLRIELDEENENGGNDTFGEGERFDFDDETDGSNPLIVFGDIENSSDVDYFRFRNEEDQNYNGTVRFQLISKKMSPLEARLSVFFDENGQLIESVVEPGACGTDISSMSIQVPPPGEELVIKVESAGSTVDFGSYALIAWVEDNLSAPAETFADRIETSLRGNYSDLNQEHFGDLFEANFDTAVADDMHTNDSPATATALEPHSNIALHSAYRIQTSIVDSTDIDFYEIQAFDSVMSVRVNALLGTSTFGLIPEVQVFDSTLQMIPGCVKVNGNGELLVEFEDLVAGDDYFVFVAANQPEGVYGIGNYDLNIAFDNETRLFPELGSGSLSRYHRSRRHSLYVARTQLFHFGLNCNPQSEFLNATIWMSIYDEDGEIKYRVATRPGETRTAKSILLRPGSYAMRVNIAFPNEFSTEAPIGIAGQNRLHSVIPFFNYQIRGIGISEPTGPELIDVADDPFSPCDKGSSDFCYPNDHRSSDPFIFVAGEEVDIPPSIPTPPWIEANNWYWAADWLG